jgi:mono/diheme cytochrome c family protein
MFVSSIFVLMIAIDADAKRGAELFQTQRCSECHAIQGVAAKPSALNSAPDLGRRLDRDYSPAGLASRIWNHAPQMWIAMRKANIDPPKLSENDVADLFAFFYLARYFDRPGDAGRGKAVFMDKKCGTCHAPRGPAIEVENWKSLRDPIELVERMWNHAARMKASANYRDMDFPQLDARELTDLLVYLQNLPALKDAAYQFRLPAAGSGSELLDSKGCTKCHIGSKALTGERVGDRTLTEIAASMWNHTPKMGANAIPLSSTEMREILGHLWSRSFFSARGGKPDRGSKYFAANCAGCHVSQKVVRGREMSTLTMVSGLWMHGPKMMAEVEKREKDWPRLTPAAVADVIAYWNKK